MIEEKKPYSLNSKSHYMTIQQINFYPLREVKPYKRKGEIESFLFWKKEYKEDLYFSYETCGDLLTKEKLLQKFGDDYCLQDGIIYKKATVEIIYEKVCSDYHKFKSNKEAETFIKELKAKCEKCGNFLL